MAVWEACFLCRRLGMRYEEAMGMLGYEGPPSEREVRTIILVMNHVTKLEGGNVR